MFLFGDEEIDAAVRVLSSRRLFRYLPDATEVPAFERELAARMGVGHALLVSSGTGALICALAALGIGPGDEVLIPAYAFVADALAPLAVGAIPVVCEIDESLTIDPADAERKITPHTRAIVPVHMNGMPCDMEAVSRLAQTRGLAIVEDACQSIGGTWRGQPLGTIGHVGAFSFNQFKILTAGEGGAIVTNRRDVYERAFIAHDGSVGHSPHRFEQALFAGLAFRAGEVTAGILRAQLAKLDRILAMLRASRDCIVDVIAAAGGPQPVRSRDPQGECGTTIAYRFDSRERADRLCQLANDADFDAFKGDQYWHAYSEWTFLHTGAGAHHPARNPLRESAACQPGCCPVTTHVLETTALLAVPATLDRSKLDRLGEQLRRELS